MPLLPSTTVTNDSFPPPIDDKTRSSIDSIATKADDDGYEATLPVRARARIIVGVTFPARRRMLRLSIPPPVVLLTRARQQQLLPLPQLRQSPHLDDDGGGGGGGGGESIVDLLRVVLFETRNTSLPVLGLAGKRWYIRAVVAAFVRSTSSPQLHSNTEVYISVCKSISPLLRRIV